MEEKVEVEKEEMKVEEGEVEKEVEGQWEEFWGGVSPGQCAAVWGVCSESH